MFEIKGRIGIGLAIDGVEFPLNRVNAIDFVHMSCSTRISIPMLHLKFIDTVEWIPNRSPIADGALVQINVSAGNNPVRSYRFRVNKVSPTRVDQSVIYELDGYLDIPKYWSGSAYKGFSGTSSAALQNIAEQCKMDYAGDSTSDTQFWFPGNAQYHHWVKDITDHGYAGTSSCMWRGVDLVNKLIYRDVSEMGQVTTKLSLASPQDDHILITDYKPFIEGGSNNHYSGYGDFRIEQRPLEASNKYRMHDKVSFNKNEEGSLLLNQSIKQSLDQNRVQFGYLDPGNNHADYERASYQNKRVTNLFTSGLTTIIPRVSDIQLLDTVGVSIDQTRDYLRQYSGTYRVSSRTIYVVGVDYYEVVELVRRTVNAKLQDSTPTVETGILYKDLP